MGRSREAAARAGWVALALAAACRGEPEDPVARQSVREATITAEIRSRILAIEELGPLPLAVDTRGGTVSVRGAVRDSSQALAVGAIARAVRGVEEVRLDLRVVPADSATAPAAAGATSRDAARPAREPSEPEERVPSAGETG